MTHRYLRQVRRLRRALLKRWSMQQLERQRRNDDRIVAEMLVRARERGDWWRALDFGASHV